MTVYRKPTATGLYTRWDSYSDTSKKIALIRTLALRATRICSSEHLNEELERVKFILQRNGYPRPIIDRIVSSVANPAPPVATVKRKPLYLRLPWMGPASAAFKKRIQQTTRRVAPFCDTFVSFTSRPLVRPCLKDVLSAENLSNVIYLFTCRCGHRYVGRTTQRLGERIKQHIPQSLVLSAQQLKAQEDDPGDHRLTDAPVSSRTRSHDNETTVDAPVSSRTRSHDNKTTVQPTSASEAVDFEPQPSDSGITRHLKANPDCRVPFADRASANAAFRILARARNVLHLAVLEAVFIASHKPVLCSQKDFVKCLALF